MGHTRNWKSFGTQKNLKAYAEEVDRGYLERQFKELRFYLKGNWVLQQKRLKLLSERKLGLQHGEYEGKGKGW